jgi:two-component system chemotaxis response regulator CheY
MVRMVAVVTIGLAICTTVLAEATDMSAKNILIVDDSFSLRQTISLALRNAGYVVEEAVDGRDALNKLDGRKYNLIISDLNMPHLDGLSFVRALKQNSHYKFTPVIMLTTENSDLRKQEGKAVGVRAWVHKPFLPTVLLDAVAKLVLP